MYTYRIIEDGNAIQCLVCNQVSHHITDVKQLYCGRCNMFHQDVEKELNSATQTITITVDLMSAICIIGNIQIAGRHPKNNGPSRKIAEDFARSLQLRVAKLHPNTGGMIEKGWDPDYDV